MPKSRLDKRLSRKAIEVGEKEVFPVQVISPGSWTIVDSKDAKVDLSDKVAWVPFGSSPTDRIIRLHEAGHVLISPKKVSDVMAKIEGQHTPSEISVRTIEDFRVNEYQVMVNKLAVIREDVRLDPEGHAVIWKMQELAVARGKIRVLAGNAIWSTSFKDPVEGLSLYRHTVDKLKARYGQAVADKFADRVQTMITKVTGDIRPRAEDRIYETMSDATKVRHVRAMCTRFDRLFPENMVDFDPEEKDRQQEAASQQAAQEAARQQALRDQQADEEAPRLADGSPANETSTVGFNVGSPGEARPSANAMQTGEADEGQQFGRAIARFESTFDLWEPEECVTWGEFELVEFPFRKKFIAKRGRNKKRLQEGVILSRPWKLPVGGRAFTRTRRARGKSSFLIDISRSMKWEYQEILELLKESPGATVGVYCGECGWEESATETMYANRRVGNEGKWVRVNSPGSLIPRLMPVGSGKVWVVAQGNKRVSEDHLEEVLQASPPQNVVDGPALRWLAKQPKPRFWISDGGVHGIVLQRSVFLSREVRGLLRRGHIEMVSKARLMKEMAR